MTREDRLYAMTGATLIQVADKLGVKVNCNKTRTALKEAKANVIDRILAAEKAAEEAETAEIMQAKKDAGVEIMEIKPEEVQIVEEVAETPNTETAEVVDTDVANDLIQFFTANNVTVKYSEKKKQIVVYKNKHRFVEIYIRSKKHIYTIAGKKEQIANIVAAHPGVEYTVRTFDKYDGLVVSADNIMVILSIIVSTMM